MTNTTNNEIIISNLTKYYHHHRVLDSIHLTIKKGEFIMLLGRSGCGKTTLLNILAGFSSFNSGMLQVQDRLAGNKTSQLKAEFMNSYDSNFHNTDSKKIQLHQQKLPKYSHLFFTKILTHFRSDPHVTSRTYQIKPDKKCIKIFQEYALLPWKNAFDNVFFALKANKIANGKEIATKYLNLVGLKEHINKFPSELSGGQKQRVAIARAMCLKPDILLLDEPFSALDYFIRENLQKLILRLSKSLNMTVVFVTHDIDEAILLGDRIIVLNNGKIVREFDNMQKPIKDSREFNHLKESIAFELQGFEETVEYSI